MDTLNSQKGFSLIEILIAMAIAIIVISGVVTASGGFGATLRGYQSTVMNAQTEAGAVAKAQQVLEQQQANARQDFGLLANTPTTSIDGFYYKSVDVTYKDIQTALITTTVSWRNDHNSTSTVKLSTLVTNLENVNSPNTCSSAMANPNGWKNPQDANFDFQQLLYGNNGNGLSLSNVHALNKRLYVTASAPPSNPNDSETFFVLDVSNPNIAPVFIGSVDNNTSSDDGMNAVTVASTTDKIYAYVGNARQRNFFTCTPAGPNCSQLQVLDVTTPSVPVVSANYKLATSSVPYVWGNTTGSNSQALGKSVFYKDGYVYLGLTTTQNGPAFHIFDVSNPLSPVLVGSWPTPSLGFGSSGAPINSIVVKGNYAYLAHPNGLVGAPNEQVTVLDVSNPTNPVRVSGYNNSIGVNATGKSLWVVGNRLYLGRTTSNPGAADNIPELYILDNSNPAAIPTTVIGSTTLATAESINTVITRDFLTFLLTTTQFKVINISNPTSISAWGSIPLAGNGGTSYDCDGDRFFVIHDVNKDHVSIVTPGP